MPGPHASDSDADLINRCLAGEPAAWEALVDRYARMVYAVPRRMGLPSHLCDDVFQDVFATVLRSLGSLRDRRRFPAWLLTIAHHASCLAVRGPGQPAGLSSAPDAPSDEQLMRWERQALVRRALDELDPRCRDLLLSLFAPTPLRYQDLSRHLSIPIGSIGPQRNRCLRRLLDVIKARSPDEPQ